MKFLKGALLVLLTAITTSIFCQEPARPSIGSAGSATKVQGRLYVEDLIQLPVRDNIGAYPTPLRPGAIVSITDPLNASEIVPLLYLGPDNGWVELPFGEFVDTIFYSAQTGSQTLIYQKTGVDYPFYTFYFPDGIITPGFVTWSGTGLTYNITATTLRVNGIVTVIPAGQVTLDTADPDDPRYDNIYVDESGYHVETGEPAPSPSTPVLEGDQYHLAFAFVAAGATEPIVPNIIWDENSESSTVTASGAGATVDPDYAGANVYHLTKAFNVSNINHNDAITISRVASWSLANPAQSINIYIKLKAVMPNSATIRLRLYNGATPIINEYTLPIDRSNTTSFQAISVPIGALGTPTSLNFTALRLRYVRSTSAAVYSGFYGDYAFIDESTTTPNPSGSIGLAFQGNAFNNITGSPTSNGTITVNTSGNSGQYIDGAFNLQTFPNLLTTMGALDGRSKTPEGGTIDLSANSFFQQTVDSDNPGIVTGAMFDRWEAQSYLQNIGPTDIDSLLMPIDVNTSGIKTLKDSLDFHIIDYGDHLTMWVDASGTGTGGLDDVLAVNQALTTDRSVPTSPYTISLPSSSSLQTLEVTNSADGNAIKATSETGTTLSVTSNDAQGILSTVNNSSTANTIMISVSDVDEDQVLPMLRLQRQLNTVDPESGFGAGIETYLITDVAVRLASEINTTWFDPTDGTRTTYVNVKGMNSVTEETFLQLQPDYQLVNNLADTLATRAYARSVGGSSFGTFDGTLQSVFDNEVGGSVLSKADSILSDSSIHIIGKSTNVSEANLYVHQTNASGFGNAIRGTSNAINGTGYFENTKTSAGGGWAIVATAVGANAAASFYRDSSSTNTIVPVFNITRTSSGTPAAGIGSSMVFSVETDNSNQKIAGDLQYFYSSAADLTRTSEINIRGINSNTTEIFANFQTGGIVRVNNLADTLATRAYARSIAPSVGGIDDVLAPNQLLTTDREIDMAANTLDIHGTNGTSGLFVRNTGAGTALNVSAAGAGSGGSFLSTSGYAVQSHNFSATLPVEYIEKENSRQAIIKPMLELVSHTFNNVDSIAAAGFGSSIDTYLENDNAGGELVRASHVVTKWTDVTDGSEDSQYEIWGMVNGVETLFATIGTGFGSTPGIDDVLAVGQTLTANRTIAAGSNKLTVTTTGNAGTFDFDNGTLSISNTGSFGIQVQTTAGVPATFDANPTSTNVVTPLVYLRRSTSNTAGVGIGGSMMFSNELSNGSLNDVNEIQSVLTNVTSGAQTSKLVFKGRSAGGALTDLVTMLGTGQLVLHSGYPANTFTGTALYDLGVDASGNVVTTATGTGTPYTDEQAQDAVGAMVNASLTYTDATPLLAIASRDNGDITTSAAGLTWTIDANTVTFAKMQAITDGVLLGAQGGTAVEEITLTAADFDLASNTLSIDYTNGQAASASNKGFLTSANWTTFNNMGRNIKTDVTDVGNVGAGEDDLITYSIPAGQLATNGDYIEFEMSFVFAANANNKQVKIKYGATTIYASGAAAQNDGAMVVSGKIIRTGAATQRITFTSSTNALLFTDYADYVTATETLSGAVTLKATGEATSNNDIIQKTLVVKYFVGN